MNPCILYCELTVNLTSISSLNAVMVAAKSNTPVPGCTFSRAIANMLVTFLGPVINFGV